MILVDTSVWIDFFAGRQERHVTELQEAIRADENLTICGIVLTEVLQGIVTDSAFRRVKRYFRPLIRLPMPEPVFIRAAEVYRTLRKAGRTTIRASNDCVIAATALHHRCRLLHNDRDFDQIAEQFPLKLV